MAPSFPPLERRLPALPARMAWLLAACRRGVVSLEYGLLAGVVTLAIVVGFGKLGSSLTNTYKDLAAKLNY